VTRVPGVVPATAAIVLWLSWGVMFGIAGPVRQSFINAHIASAQRATVLSLDAFFGDVGGGVGQPALGWLAGRRSFGLSWLVGAGFLALTAPLYAWAGRADRASKTE
jgi:predicted MFS family arabinose efflux permease